MMNIVLKRGFSWLGYNLTGIVREIGMTNDNINI